MEVETKLSLYILLVWGDQKISEQKKMALEAKSGWSGIVRDNMFWSVWFLELETIWQKIGLVFETLKFPNKEYCLIKRVYQKNLRISKSLLHLFYLVLGILPKIEPFFETCKLPF